MHYLDKSHKQNIVLKKPNTREHICMITLYKILKESN